MPKVSVIVPIYGVEKYIERCARSLFEQTLDDMEFIFVDDCTTDNSIKVLENVIKDYPSRQSQIKILHHEVNKGLSRARETGLRVATGDYVAHCDSDDWVDINMYETLFYTAKCNDYDIVKSGYITSDGYNNKEYPIYIDKNKLDRESLIRYLLLEKRWNNIWNILVKRTLYKTSNIRFTEYAMLEDYFVVTQLLLHSKSTGVVNKSFYYYFQNPLSICRVTDTKSIIIKSYQASKNISEILNFIHNIYGNKFKKEETCLLFIPRRILIPIMDKFENYKYWKKTTSGNTLRFLSSRYISIKHKLWYLEVEFFIRPVLK